MSARGGGRTLALLGLLAVAPALAEVRFREAAAELGVDFVHQHGGTGDFFMIETMGAGVAWIDYDGDGDDDLVLVQSGRLPLAQPADGGPVLFRNDGGTAFVDVTAAAGLTTDVYGMGATAADVDADGDVDLYVTAFGPNRLFLNNGDGSFRDATAGSGVEDPSWSASAAFVDFDGDGAPDLYVTNYVDFSFDDNPPCGLPERGLRSYCHPDVYEGLPDRLFRNLGGGRFEDASARLGHVADGKGLGVVAGDLDADGRTDLYVANDMTANFLFLNRGGRFEEAALVSGVAFDDRGNAEAGMGVDLGDLDGNGYDDLVVTHLDQQTNALYSNTGSGLYVDRRFPSRLAEPSFHKVGFGVALADLDHDGHLDVLIGNGHIIHNVDSWGTTTSFRQANQLLRGRGDGSFDEVADSGLDVVRSSRGLALADLDLDGDLDVAISNSTDPAEVYLNETSPAARWLQLLLRGPSPGLGTVVVVRSDAGSWRRELRSASSYLSQNGVALHVGLGAARPDALEVRWSDGARWSLRQPPWGRRLVLDR